MGFVGFVGFGGFGGMLIAVPGVGWGGGVVTNPNPTKLARIFRI